MGIEIKRVHLVLGKRPELDLGSFPGKIKRRKCRETVNEEKGFVILNHNFYRASVRRITVKREGIVPGNVLGFSGQKECFGTKRFGVIHKQFYGLRLLLSRKEKF